MSCIQTLQQSTRCHFLSKAAMLLLMLGLVGCAGKKAPVQYRPAPAQPAVAVQETPAAFTSLLHPANQELRSWKDMAPTIRKSLNYTERKPSSAIAVSRPGLKVTYGELTESLQLLRSLLPQLDANPSLLLQHFRFVRVDPYIKYSGYYEPVIHASRTKTAKYSQPIYALPPDMASYRRKHGRYYSREDIDGPRKVLAGKGLELAWADPVDVYFLQIQGSGRLLFDDNTSAYLNYAGQNGHKYRASGRIIVSQGYKLERGDILEQREWFKRYPERMNRVFFANPSYVFFKFSTRGSVGAMGQPLDDWVSLATDRNFLPLGGIVAYGVNIPDRTYGTTGLRGLGLAQDTGGAIKRNRIDIYCGGADKGIYVSAKLDAKGPAWLLLKK